MLNQYNSLIYSRARKEWEDLPLGRFDREISSTMSTFCSICSTQSPASEQTGLMSMDIVCQAESKSLCPSSRLEMPALPLQGSNLRNGVRFSVHTTSLGNTPCSSCRLSTAPGGCTPSGSKERTGRIVLVESMKFKLAQKRLLNALVSVSHLAFALPFCQYFVQRQYTNW